MNSFFAMSSPGFLTTSDGEVNKTALVNSSSAKQLQLTLNHVKNMFTTFDTSTENEKEEEVNSEEEEEEDNETHAWYPDVYHIGKKMLLQDTEG